MDIRPASLTRPKSSILSFRKMSEMKMRVHSILTVVNATADVERTLREDWEDGGRSGTQVGAYDQPQICSPDRVARFYGGKINGKQNEYGCVSWGILFGSEYFWAPDIGPMLIVCPNGFTNAGEASSRESNKTTFNNCCILQFEDQLSTRSSLRIFHCY